MHSGNRQSIDAPKLVKGELLDSRQQAVSNKALDSLSKTVSDNGLISRLLQPKEQRLIAAKLKDRIREVTVDDAISKITSEANKRCAEIELTAEAQRNRILLMQNTHLGQLKQQEQQVVSREIQNMLVDERENQRKLAATRLLPEDQQMLAQLFKHRTTLELLSVAESHGVQLATSPIELENQPGKESLE